MQERCQLIESSKVLAEQKGLDKNQVSCPVMQSCDGTSCIYIAPAEIQVTDTTPKQRFFSRLEKWREINQNGSQ